MFTASGEELGGHFDRFVYNFQYFNHFPLEEKNLPGRM